MGISLSVHRPTVPPKCVTPCKMFEPSISYRGDGDGNVETWDCLLRSGQDLVKRFVSEMTAT